jgi:hypothetical protein
MLELDIAPITNIQLKEPQSYDDIMLENIGKRFKFEIDNHLHELLGFFDIDNSRTYIIDNIVLSESDNQLDINNIYLHNIDLDKFEKKQEIDSENIYNITNLEKIKLMILTHLKQNITKLKYMSNIINNTKINLENIKSNVKCDVYFISDKTEILFGGFNPDIMCVEGEIKGLVKFYTEPVIQLIHSFIYNFYQYTLKHEYKEKYGENAKPHYPFGYKTLYDYFKRKHIPEEDIKLYYDNIMESISKDRLNNLDYAKKVLREINFSQEMLASGEYIKEILVHHLLNNKYAHNGISDMDILVHLSKLIKKDIFDIDNLLFMHTYLHYLDELNMADEKHIQDGR